MPIKVLIVDDDKNICELLRLYLAKNGMETACVQDGAAVEAAVQSFKPDLVLLDLMLPYVDGMTLCGRLREQSALPIIMLTAKSETEDKILGLTLGADDYITKPFDPNEVVARIHAVLRRGKNPQSQSDDVLEFENLTIKISSYELWIRGEKVELPRKEMELLHYLALHPGRVFTRDQLLDGVWGFDYVGDTRTVDVHIKRLRKRLEGLSDRWTLRTVWGVGYKFEVMDANEEKSI